VVGNVHARGRVDIKKDGSVIHRTDQHRGWRPFQRPHRDRPDQVASRGRLGLLGSRILAAVDFRPIRREGCFSRLSSGLAQRRRGLNWALACPGYV
jgi:hypothetical protein